MKFTKLLLFIFFCFIGLTACSSKSPIPKRPELVKVQDTEFFPPEIKKWKTASGLEVLLLEDHELPLISGQFYFRFGSLTQDSASRGEIDALMSQLRAGGVLDSTPQALDAELDSVGASIEGSAGGEFSSVSFFSHKDDEQLIFSKIAAIFTTPKFDERRLSLWKSQVIESIERRREDPDTIAAATFATALYGKDNVYSALPTKDTISSLTSERLRSLSRNLIVPDRAILAVSGDISRDRLDELLTTYLSTWQGRAELKMVAPPPDYQPKPGVYFVDSKFQQSAVVIGQRGPARMSKDQYALSVFNRYFSRGGFGSVLFTEVRSKRGFAYDVDGGFSPGAKTGEFAISMGTRGEVTESAIREVLSQVSKAREVTPELSKIDDVKVAVKQGFVFNFAKPASALTREVFLELLGYPDDFNKTYLDNITSVTPDEVKQCLSNRVSVDDLIIVVVGKIDGKSLAKSIGVPFYEVKFDTYPQVAQ